MKTNSPARPHLAASGAALLLLLAALGGGGAWCRHYERAHFEAILPLLMTGKQHDDGTAESLAALEHLKNQGRVFQQRVLERPDILPLYGSSELVKQVPDKASTFYRHFPSGFSVLPVGRAGATSLILWEKIASLSAWPAGSRVALSLSPSWFLGQTATEHAYAGNFSHRQALAALLNPRLSGACAREFARRLLRHPQTLENDPLLRLMVAGRTGGSLADRVLSKAVLPFAHLREALALGEEHIEAWALVRLHERRLKEAPAHEPALLDWESLIAEASATTSAGSFTTIARPQVDARFRARLAKAPEWDDLELLLRGLRELGVSTLVMSIPPDAAYYEHVGVSQQTLASYNERLRALAGKYGAQVETFDDHEEDPAFFADHHDHLSAKGWMYFNRALDQFYHADPAALATRHHKNRHHA